MYSMTPSTNPAMIEQMTGLQVQTLPPLNMADPTAAVDEMANHLPRYPVGDTE
jgi:hypothetical protein